MTYPELLGFVRETWGREALKRNGSCVKALWKKWGARNTEAMVKGAALLGWPDLRTINSADGLGRRMALAKFWAQENTRPPKMPERLLSIFQRLGKSTV